MSVELDDNSRKELWVYGVLRQLRIWGLIEAGFPEMTDRGLAVWDQIDKDIHVVDEDVSNILSIACGKPFGADSPEVVLIRAFRDSRERMMEFIAG